ncbi:MAG: tetraacyldisaccharide 4'-kinase [Thermodesulfobacteriota bacterium]|nr:MAG: tetraacyldisaccharide 4'-kinase [Thermodesulfobacteriota bacterium]
MESPGAAGAFLYPLSILYGAGVRTRLAAYRAGVLKQRKIPCTVISVGNITAGGSGKTPMTIFLARFLRERGEKVVVVSRGYKGTSKGVNVVSDGEVIFMGPKSAGDEPCLMARRLKGVPVVVGPDRVRAGLFSIEKFSPDFIILDDGFQHIRLMRDLNILLVDSETGLGNFRLLPSGILREPAGEIKRADLIMVKGKGLGHREAALIKGFGMPVSGFDYRACGMLDLREKKLLATEGLKGRRAFAFAGIARPGAFFKTLKALGADVAGTASYPDHHVYRARDIEEINEEAGGVSAEVIITTEKDGVKLEGLLGKSKGPPLYALSVEVVLKDPAGFERLMAPYLKGKPGPRSL